WALALRPKHAGALNNRGNTLQGLNRFEDALSSYERALAVRPHNAAALTNHGNTLLELRRFAEALASYERAMTLEPRHKRAPSGLASCALRICDWARWDNLSAEICRHVIQQKSVIAPFCFLGYSGDPYLQLLCAKNYLREVVAVPRQPLWRGAVWRHDKIRLAYVSADFHRHPTAYLAAELFERHDRSQFEVIAISLGPDERSEIRARLTAAFDRFFDARTRSDEDIARLLNELRVDIAIDLKGHTKNARPGIFAFRPAPIQ